MGMFMQENPYLTIERESPGLFTPSSRKNSKNTVTIEKNVVK